MVGTAAVAVGTIVCAAFSMQIVSLLAAPDLVAHCQRGISVVAKPVYERPCPTCQGSGRVVCSRCTGLGATSSVQSVRCAVVMLAPRRQQPYDSLNR